MELALTRGLVHSELAEINLFILFPCLFCLVVQPATERLVPPSREGNTDFKRRGKWDMRAMKTKIYTLR